MPIVCSECGSELNKTEPRKAILIIGSRARIELAEIEITDTERFLFKVMESGTNRAYPILRKEELAIIIGLINKVIQ
jgi:hypothetical protein